MKLAIVSSYFPIRDQPYRGQTAYKTAVQLSSWMSVEAICPFTRYPRWFQPRNFPHLRPDPTYSPDGIKTTYLEYPGLPWITRISNGMMCEHYIEEHVRRARADLLQSYWLYPDGYATLRVGQKLGIPVVLVAIGSDLNRIPDPLTKYFTRKALSQADHVMTMSRYLLEKAIALGANPKKGSSHINGCDTEVFHRRDRPLCRTQLHIDIEDELICYVGRLDMTKGLGELLHAAAALVPKHPRLRVALVGDGPATSSLQTLAKQLDIAQKVNFLGACNSETVARWLGACDVFSLPSYSEGSPNVVIEALNCGRPVVATDVGGIPELVDSGAGILVPPRNAEALAQALGTALKASWDEENIARRFRRSWRDLALEMRTVFEPIVEANAKMKVQR
jgi:teichuronic acid biosynthesis glycosyltransferase TuaC